MLHPEKVPRVDAAYRRLKDVWLCLVLEDSLENLDLFAEKIKQYTESFFEEVSKIKDPMSIARLSVAYGRVVRDWLVEQLGFSYSLLGMDKRFSFILDMEMIVLGQLFSNSAALSKENYMTGVFIDHALKIMEMTGNKIYEVSSGLRWQLENTELQKYPTDGLRSPFPCVYIALPEKTYKVYNEWTDWHDVDGVYIVEDTETIPRTWRMIVTGLPNENSFQKEYDDALYHWVIRLPENKSVEEALQESFDVAIRQIEGEKQFKKVKKDGEIVDVEIAVEKNAIAKRQYFDMMHKSLVSIFRYVMKVMIYATLPDYEWVYKDASSEYDSLRARADKLIPGSTKKKKILSRMKMLGAHPRILLGGRIVVDRATREAFEAGTSEGRHQHVRSLVTGHFHHYWIGPKGQQTLDKKFVAPYWRGPETAPLTQKKHVLKSDGV